MNVVSSEGNFTHLIFSSSDDLKKEVFLEPRCLSSLWCWRLMLNEHINLGRFRVRWEQRRHSHSGSGFPANSVILRLFCFLLLQFGTTAGHYWLPSVSHSSHSSDGSFD